MSRARTVPAAKIAMIRASIGCLGFGVLALLPLIGLPFALVAAWQSGSARRYEKALWNPARPHRLVGMILAVLGALLWTLVDVLVIYRLLNRYIHG